MAGNNGDLKKTLGEFIADAKSEAQRQVECEIDKEKKLEAYRQHMEESLFNLFAQDERTLYDLGFSLLLGSPNRDRKKKHLFCIFNIEGCEQAFSISWFRSELHPEPKFVMFGEGCIDLGDSIESAAKKLIIMIARAKLDRFNEDINSYENIRDIKKKYYIVRQIPR